MGTVVVARGELWWLEVPHEKGRPVLVIARDTAIAVMQRVMVAPVTTTVRFTPSQLSVGPEEGLAVESVANFDDLQSVPKSCLVRKLGNMDGRMAELCSTLRAMADC